MNHLHLRKPHHSSEGATSDPTTLVEDKTRTPSVGYQYQESAQNFPAPEHMKATAPVEYSDQKAADLAHRASQAGREDLRDMLDHFVQQRQEAEKSYDPALVFQQM